jgi:hypothetical protein
MAPKKRLAILEEGMSSIAPAPATPAEPRITFPKAQAVTRVGRNYYVFTRNFAKEFSKATVFANLAGIFKGLTRTKLQALACLLNISHQHVEEDQDGNVKLISDAQEVFAEKVATTLTNESPAVPARSCYKPTTAAAVVVCNDGWMQLPFYSEFRCFTELYDNCKLDRSGVQLVPYMDKEAILTMAYGLNVATDTNGEYLPQVEEIRAGEIHEGRDRRNGDREAGQAHGAHHQRVCKGVGGQGKDARDDGARILSAHAGSD